MTTAYCYHCGRHHPLEEMRHVVTRSGKRWRCIRSIEATRATESMRDAFGRKITAINKTEAEDRARQGHLMK